MLTLCQTGHPREWIIASSDPHAFRSFYECFHARRGVKTIRVATSTLAPSTAAANSSSSERRITAKSSSAPWVDPLSGLLQARVDLTPITRVSISDAREDGGDVAICNDDPWAAYLRKSPESLISAKGLKRRLARAVETNDERGSAALNDAELSLEVRLSRSSSSVLVAGGVDNESIPESVFVDVSDGDDDGEEDPFDFPVSRRRLEDLDADVDDDDPRYYHDQDPRQSPETLRLRALAKMPSSPLPGPKAPTRVFASHSASSCSSTGPTFEGASSGYDSLSTPERGDGTVGFDDDVARGRFVSTDQILAAPQFSLDRPFSPARLGSPPLPAFGATSPSCPTASSDDVFPITTIATPFISGDRKGRNTEGSLSLDDTEPSTSRHFGPQVLSDQSVSPSAGAISVLSLSGEKGAAAEGGVDEVFLHNLNAANLPEFTMDQSTEDVFDDAVDRECDIQAAPFSGVDGIPDGEDISGEGDGAPSPASSNFSFLSCQSAVDRPIEVVQGNRGMSDEHTREVVTEDDSALDGRISLTTSRVGNDATTSSSSVSFRRPSSPSMIEMAKRNTRVEKVSHVQYRCRWCHRTFPRSSDCYFHFLKAHSGGKTKGGRGKLGSKDRNVGRRGGRHGDCEPQHQPYHNASCQFCGETPDVRRRPLALDRRQSYFSSFAPSSRSPSYSSSSSWQRGARMALKRHEECGQGLKEYRCLFCGKRFHYATSLKAHVRGAHGAGSKADLTTG